MSKYHREKGKRGERILVKHLCRLFPEHADKIERGWQSRVSVGEMDVKGVPAIWWENKYSNKPMPLAALRQAVEDPRRDPHLIPIAVCITTGAPKAPVAIVRLHDLATLIRHGRELVNLDVTVQIQSERERVPGKHKHRADSERKRDRGGSPGRGWRLKRTRSN